MFSEASVILFTGGRRGGLCMMSLPFWLSSPMFLLRGGVSVPSSMFLWVGEESVCEGGKDIWYGHLECWNAFFF